jgi:hypothetical protein
VVRRANPRATAASMMRCTLSQCSPSSSAACESERHAAMTATANASKWSVKREPGSAHGTRTAFTPCFSHRQRGVAQRSSSRYCITLRCRHVRSASRS